VVNLLVRSRRRGKEEEEDKERDKKHSGDGNTVVKARMHAEAVSCRDTIGHAHGRGLQGSNFWGSYFRLCIYKAYLVAAPIRRPVLPPLVNL
jgi:hypothetical protein